MLPTYEFYIGTYWGNQIAEADFPRLTARASAFLDSLACNPSGASEEPYKMAICAVAEAWQVNEQGGDLASQSVGSWNKSYAQKKPKSNEQRLLDAAKLYLGNYCDLSVRWI